MIIEKDKILNKWVVWLVNGSALLEIYRAKTKNECVGFLERKEKCKKKL